MDMDMGVMVHLYLGLLNIHLLSIMSL